MGRIRDGLRVLCVGLVAHALMLGSAVAGTVSIAWDPVSDSDVAGYVVYWGTTSGVYTNQEDVGLATTATIPVGDCTTWFVAVKAYDRDRNYSVEYSNEVSGWGRPTIETITPAVVERGWSTYVDIEGMNFKPATRVEVEWPGVTVGSVNITACGALRALVSVPNNAAEGFANVTVVQPDGVYGTAVAAMEISRDKTPPGQVPNHRREGDRR